MSAAHDSLAVRPATPADLPALMSLLGQLTDVMEAPVQSLPERVAENIRRFSETPNGLLLVAERNAQIVGLVSLNLRRTLLHPKPVALIDELVVADSVRGQGVGRRLIAEAIDYAKRRHCAELEVATESTNSSALEFYRGCGFDTEHVLLEMEFADGPA